MPYITSNNEVAVKQNSATLIFSESRDPGKNAALFQTHIISGE